MLMQFVLCFFLISQTVVAMTFSVFNRTGKTSFEHNGKTYSNIRFRIVNKKMENRSEEMDFLNANADGIQKLFLGDFYLKNRIQEDIEKTRLELGLPESDWMTIYVTADCIDGGKQTQRLLSVHTLKSPFPMSYMEAVFLTFTGLDERLHAILEAACLPNSFWLEMTKRINSQRNPTAPEYIPYNNGDVNVGRFLERKQ